MEITSKNIIDNLVIFKIYLEICLKFVYNLDNNANLLLMLLKNEEKMLLVHNKFFNVFSKKVKNEIYYAHWETYLQLKDYLDNMYRKVKDYFKANGGDIKFSPNNEVKYFSL